MQPLFLQSNGIFLLWFLFYFLLGEFSPGSNSSSSPIVPMPSIQCWQQRFGTVILPDSSGIRKNDSVSHALLPETQMVITDHLINRKDKPVSFSVSHRTVKSREGFFYPITGMALFAGPFRYFFQQVFHQSVPVFNTSLRQSQLTDQLLQANSFPAFQSVLCNFSAGVYAYTILRYMVG